MPAPRSNRQQDLNLKRRIALTAAAGLLATAAIAQSGFSNRPIRVAACLRIRSWSDRCCCFRTEA
jgi:hypothetical protein